MDPNESPYHTFCKCFLMIVAVSMLFTVQNKLTFIIAMIAIVYFVFSLFSG